MLRHGNAQANLIAENVDDADDNVLAETHLAAEREVGRFRKSLAVIRPAHLSAARDEANSRCIDVGGADEKIVADLDQLIDFTRDGEHALDHLGSKVRGEL